MNRVGFYFKIKPELKDEYKKAHDEIWPELVVAMSDCGIHNYSIYFREDGICFAYMEIEGDFDKQMEELSKLEVTKRWQKINDKRFENDDKSIRGPEMKKLEEVFHMD